MLQSITTASRLTKQELQNLQQENSHKKIQKIRMVQNGPPYLSVKKKFRWIERVRTWSSPPSSARISSILLDAPFSKCQGLTRKYYGPTIQPTTLTTPTNPSTQQTYPPTPPIIFNHEGGVPQKSSESKNVLERSPLLVCQKNFNHPLGLTLSTPSLVTSC